MRETVEDYLTENEKRQKKPALNLIDMHELI